ncbi:hypothetical protein [Desulfothermobacter acidiphilus]|uniref:hypothetical protein n=1 Tax=Desulfothermobacter acidiphilus TaxID=1938353 RepID=UPI003F8A15B4
MAVVSSLAVEARLLRKPEKVRAVARSLRRLFDGERRDLRPSEFGVSDLAPGGKVVNAVLLMVYPPEGRDPVAFGREVVLLLERRKKVKLSWAGGVRKGGRVWLLIKARAWELPDYRPRRFFLSKADLMAVYQLAKGR